MYNFNIGWGFTSLHPWFYIHLVHCFCEFRHLVTPEIKVLLQCFLLRARADKVQPTRTAAGVQLTAASAVARL